MSTGKPDTLLHDFREFVAESFGDGSLGQFSVTKVDPPDVYDEEELLVWVKKNYPPDDVYNEELDRWAERSGYRHDE